jgi:hypothetical protein
MKNKLEVITLLDCLFEANVYSSNSEVMILPK